MIKPVYRSLARVIIALACSCPSVALATKSLILRHPLKIITCESLLRGQLKTYATKENPLLSVRDAIWTLRKQVGIGTTDMGHHYSEILYTGSIVKMSSATAVSAIQRLTAIEQNLLSPNLDAQVVVFEIRGKNIEEALKALKTDYSDLLKIYSEFQSEQPALAGNLGVALTYWNSAECIRNVFRRLTEAYASAQDGAFIYSLPLAYFISYVAYRVYSDQRAYDHLRFDNGFNQLLRSLERANSPQSVDDVFISSQSFSLPSEFNSMLLAEDGKDANIEEVRRLAFGEVGPNMITTALRNASVLFKLLESRLRREVLKAGDTERRVFLDSFVYNDPSTQEPVWLFAYRSFRRTPSGRKPKKLHEQEESREYAPIPGLPEASGG